MSSLVNKLVSNISSISPSSQPNHAAGHPNVLSIHRNIRSLGSFDITPYGPALVNGSLYHAKLSKLSKPQVTVWKGQQQILTARTHSLSSKIDLVVYGKPIAMAESNLSGNFTIQSSMGELKWKFNQLTGTSCTLVDSNGTKLAAIKSNHMPGMGDQKIELFVSFDPAFLDLVIGTAMIVKLQGAKTLKGLDPALEGLVEASSGIEGGGGADGGGGGGDGGGGGAV